MLELTGPDAVVGMVHLPPLPGAPRYERGDGGRERVHERALSDARALDAGGVSPTTGLGLFEHFTDDARAFFVGCTRP